MPENNTLYITGESALPGPLQEGLPNAMQWIGECLVLDSIPEDITKLSVPFLLRIENISPARDLDKGIRSARRARKHFAGVLISDADTGTDTVINLLTALRVKHPSLSVYFEVTPSSKIKRLQLYLFAGINGLFLSSEIHSKQILNKLGKLEVYNGQPKELKQLNILRSKLESTTDAIIKLMSERRKTVEAIAAIKKRNRLPILQPGQWEKVKKKALQQAEKNGLKESDVMRWLEAIHEHAIRVQQEVYERKK